MKLFENSYFSFSFHSFGFFQKNFNFFVRYLLHLEQIDYQAIQKFVCQISAYIEKSAEKSAAHLPESASGSAFFFSKGERERERVLFLASERERERVRHFEERANALLISKGLLSWGIQFCYIR